VTEGRKQRPPARTRTAPKRPEPRPGFIAVGFIRGPHALDGEVKVELLTDHPDRFRPGAQLLAGARAYTIVGARMHQKALLLELEGINTREDAESLRDTLLEVAEADLPPLPEGAYYRYQLIGIEAFDKEGAPLGRIEEVLDTGANDVYVVRNDEGELLLPAIDTVIMRVDIAAGRVEADVPAGLERRPDPKQKRAP
jgi:16S rRNA processing protein RimM